MAHDQSQGNFPLGGDGWSNEEEATASCFCGAVQLSFPVKKPGLVNTFVCNCTDCHKVCQMMAWNFTADDKYIKYIRGFDNLSTYTTKKSIESGNDMTNYFCKTCGTLMNRKSSGAPGQSFLRSGTVDDFKLHDTVLRPENELYVGSRVKWFKGVEGAKEWPGMPQ